jgi:hypothetical protein
MIRTLITLTILLGCIESSLAQNWVEDYTVSSSVAGDAFGSAIISVGDLDGDGTADFATGSPDYGASLFRSGSISFFSGADGSLLATRDGEEV